MLAQRSNFNLGLGRSLYSVVNELGRNCVLLKILWVVEPDGIEPTTSGLQSQRSPS